MNKLLTTILAILIGLVGIASFATAADFEFKSIEVDGVEVLGTDQSIAVERDDTVDVRVQFVASDLGGQESDRVRVKVWIGGFEFGDVSERSDIFSVEEGVTYVKKLRLEIPDDIEIDDGSFRLHVEVFDDNDVSREETFSLRIREPRHSLQIQDVVFYPSNTVEAGRALRTVVRVENMGQKKEEDILVKVSIPELGISTRNYIDELTSSEEDDRLDREETSDSSRDLVLLIPSDAETGEYEVNVRVEFNRGHDFVTQRSTIFVQGASVADVSDNEAIVSVDMTAQDVTRGSEIPYRVMLANLGNKRILYSVDVEGEDFWATSRVQPAFISVDQGQAGEFLVFLRANDNAGLGQQSFRVNIMADGVQVNQVDLRANVVDQAPVTQSVDFEKGLEVAFIVLIIVLIILGLVIAFRRVGRQETSRTEEPETIDGQTYY